MTTIIWRFTMGVILVGGIVAECPSTAHAAGEPSSEVGQADRRPDSILDRPADLPTRFRRVRTPEERRATVPGEIEDSASEADQDASTVPSTSGGPTPPRPVPGLMPSVETPDGPTGTEVAISGDATRQVDSSIVEFTGHVSVLRRGVKLATDTIRYNRKTKELTALGNITLADPSYTLACGKLVLYGPQEMGVAWDSPRIVQARKDASGDLRERIEMVAFQMCFYTAEQRLEGLERVRLYRQVWRDGKMTLDFKISADALSTNLITRQTIFKGDVTVESPAYSVSARRLIFDPVSDRFTCVGAAKVVGHDTQGQPSSTIQGEKLVYFIRERRSLVLGAVAAVLDPDKGLGERPLNLDPSQEAADDLSWIEPEGSAAASPAGSSVGSDEGPATTRTKARRAAAPAVKQPVVVLQGRIPPRPSSTGSAP